VSMSKGKLVAIADWNRLEEFECECVLTTLYMRECLENGNWGRDG
jgi:hypothetical protein